MNREMPSQEEQDVVAWYVLYRPLVRPNTSYKRAAGYSALFLLVNIGVTILLYHLFHWSGIFSILPPAIAAYVTEHPVAFATILSLFLFFISSLLVLKRAMIGAIHLYQRYASEHTRRKCLCKPTCFEYAILAIEKYGVIKGGWKIYIRLFKKCRGRIYMIDEP